MGLSACLDTLKKNGIGKSLYLKFASDCKELEKQIGKRILCYWTTASPIPYYWFCKNYIDVQPDIHGDCSPERKIIICDIVRHKYQQVSIDNDAPFVLKSAVSNFRFSDREKKRLTEAMIDLNVNVFDKYGLDETNGDRFLMTGYVP